MKATYLVAACLVSTMAFSQSKKKKEKLEFPKEVALYQAKQFAAFNLAEGKTDSVNLFSITPLEEGGSGEMTTLYFQSSANNVQGLILGFHGVQMMRDGKKVKDASDFVFLPKDKAMAFLDRIEQAFEKQKDYLGDDKNENNAIFEYEGLMVILYRDSGKNIRIFWNGFDAEWELGEVEATKKKMMKMVGGS